MNSKLISSVALIGMEVKNLEGQDLGDIVDIMLDEDSGATAYAVIATGFMGLGDRYLAVPWRAFRINSKKELVQLDISRDDFKRAPSFDKENWPAFPHADFIREVHDYFGFPPYWEENGDRD